jgi:kinesin family protein C1
MPQAQIEKLQASLTDAERRVYESELIRRKLHNTIQELKGNIRVFCRVRPANQNETKEVADSMAVDFPSAGELAGTRG